MAGLGNKSRKQLSKLLRGSKGIITVDLAVNELGLSAHESAQLLAKWTEQGWLMRVKRGVYIPVPLEATDSSYSVEDPWVIAAKLFEPCYIGGWSAAGYWDLTEQVFKSVVVVTTKGVRSWRPSYCNVDFYIKRVRSEYLFGFRGEWRGQVRVNVSDPSRTIIDMLNDVQLGGGIRPVFDVFKAYMQSDKKDMKLLREYAKRQNNGTVFKRMGYFIERYYPEEKDSIDYFRENISAGYSAIDPSLGGDRIITRWRLRVPDSWAVAVDNDK